MPLKVIQYATGNVGRHALRGIIERPDMELVAVRVFNPDKVGTDAGELLGVEPVGVLCTDSFDEILERTMLFNPTRSESSLRRGILHNAKERADGKWVWRYDLPDRERTDVVGRFADLWDAGGGQEISIGRFARDVEGDQGIEITRMQGMLAERSS